MNSKKSSNKITDIVRLQQILKKWKKLAINGHQKNTCRSSGTPSGINMMMINTTAPGANSTSSSTSTKSNNNINRFLKKTLSFSESSSSSPSSSDVIRVVVVPKGYLAVCVGEELKRFVIPMEYLGHQAFALLLREAEEEFGFQQEGVLKIPCQVSAFEKILKMMELDNKRASESAVDDAFEMFRSFHDYSNITVAAAAPPTTSTTTPPTSEPNNTTLGYCQSPPPDCEPAARHHHHLQRASSDVHTSLIIQ